MTVHSVKHDTFFVEHSYNVSPARFFAAWADRAAKADWFGESEEFDFRAGGRETLRSHTPEGPIYTLHVVYQEIVPDNRIVYTSTIDKDDTRISAAVMTVEFHPEGGGTQLVYTEQCVFLDGLDSVEDHLEGAKDLVEKLELYLRRNA